MNSSCCLGKAGAGHFARSQLENARPRKESGRRLVRSGADPSFTAEQGGTCKMGTALFEFACFRGK